jgi:cbb3-type cytochrome oxidase subunit 3
MNRFLGILLFVAVVDLSVFTLAYTWHAWDEYKRKQIAYEECAEFAPGEDRSSWMKRRVCFNTAMVLNVPNR